MTDPTDPATVPDPVRREAFREAMLAVRRVLTEHGCRLDVIAELELVDHELAAIYANGDAPDAGPAFGPRVEGPA